MILGFAAELQDNASKNINKIRTGIALLNKDFLGLAGVISDSSEAIKKFSFKNALTSVATGIVGVGGLGLWGRLAEPAREFEVSLKNVQFVMQKTEDQMERVKEKAFQVGAATLFSAKDVTDSWYQLASYGLGASVRIFEATSDGYRAVTDKLGQQIERDMAEMSLNATLNLATMSAGTLDLADSAKFAGIVVNKMGLDMSKVFMDGDKQITLLDRAMDMFARTTQLTGYQVRDFPIAFNSMRTAVADLNMSLNDALAITGVFKTAGMTAAQAGHTLSAFSRTMVNFSKQLARADMYSELAMQKGKSTGTRGERQVFWIKKLFGDVGSFKKALSDEKGKVTNLIDFLKDVDRRIQKTMPGATEIEKQGILGLFLGGGQQGIQAFKQLSSFKTILDKDVVAVDEWGRYLDKNGKIVQDATKAQILFNKGTYEGLEAVKALSAQIKMSGGVAEKYAEVMKGTSQGLRTLGKGIRETFMILVGEHVLPILNTFIKISNKFWMSLTNWIKEHPRLTKFIVTLGIVGTVIPIIVSVFTGLAAIFGMLILKTATLTLAILGLVGKFRVLFVVLTKGIGGAVPIVGRFFGRIASFFINLGNKVPILGKVGKGIQSIGKVTGQASKYAVSQLKQFPIIGRLISGVGKIFESIKNLFITGLTKLGNKFPWLRKVVEVFTKGLGPIGGKAVKSLFKFLGPVLGIVNVIKGTTAIWKDNIWGIRDAFKGVGQSIWDFILKPIRYIQDQLKLLSTLFRFITDIIFKGSVSLEDWQFLEEKIGLKNIKKILDFFATDLGKLLRSFGVLVGYLSEMFKMIGRMFGGENSYLGEGVKQMSLVGGGIGAIIGSFFGPLGTLIGTLIGTLGGGLIAVIINIVRNWERFLEDIKKVKEFVSTKLSDAWKVFFNNVAKFEFGRDMIAVFKVLGNYMKSFFDLLKNQIMVTINYFRLLWDVIRYVWALITGKGNVEILGKNLDKSAERFKNSFISAIKSFGKFFLNIIRMATLMLVQIPYYILKWTVKGMLLLSSKIYGFFSKLMDNAIKKGGVLGSIARIVQTIMDVMVLIADIGRFLAIKLFGAIETFGPRLLDFFKSVWKNITGFFETQTDPEVMKARWEKTKAFMDKIFGKFGIHIDWVSFEKNVVRMKDSITGAFKAAFTWVSDSFRKFINGVTVGFQNILSFIYSSMAAMPGVSKKKKEEYSYKADLAKARAIGADFYNLTKDDAERYKKFNKGMDLSKVNSALLAAQGSVKGSADNRQLVINLPEMGPNVSEEDVKEWFLRSLRETGKYEEFSKSFSSFMIVEGEGKNTSKISGVFK